LKSPDIAMDPDKLALAGPVCASGLASRLLDAAGFYARFGIGHRGVGAWCENSASDSRLADADAPRELACLRLAPILCVEAIFGPVRSMVNIDQLMAAGRCGS